MGTEGKAVNKRLRFNTPVGLKAIIGANAIIVRDINVEKYAFISAGAS